jgi:starch phosphorylase
LLQCNPKLSDAITARIGDGWVKNLKELEGLHAYVDDAEFHKEIQEIKRHNKQLLADIIEDRNGVRVSVDSIFDVQVKRLHQYKRQLMNCLHIISLYWRLKDDPSLDIVPRTFIFGGKAAPGYWMAKQHIKLINDVAEIVNNDPIVDGRIRVVFVPNYNVSFAERIIPAADISEQISMAGKEASGTGNMKFSMNGALTVGTLDGANIEIREEVGAENFFLFGLIASEVKEVIRNGYNPSDYIEQSARLRRVIESIESGFFSPGEPDRFEAIVHDLRCEDDFLVCADFDAYVACHDEVDRIYRDQTEWTRRVIKNIASMGKFSSDRTIQQYADEIWDIARTPIALDE